MTNPEVAVGIKTTFSQHSQNWYERLHPLLEGQGVAYEPNPRLYLLDNREVTQLRRSAIPADELTGALDEAFQDVPPVSTPLRDLPFVRTFPERSLLALRVLSDRQVYDHRRVIGSALASVGCRRLLTPLDQRRPAPFMRACLVVAETTLRDEALGLREVIRGSEAWERRPRKVGVEKPAVISADMHEVVDPRLSRVIS